jgi:hypothetical protein
MSPAAGLSTPIAGANPRDVQALAYKGLLLRTQATLEPDPEKQQALISEADKLRAEAIRLRNQK